MADTKGITIQFRGDTTDFEKAVKQVNGELKETKSEISLLNKQLKFDPKNVELLGKKFDALQQKEKQLTDLTKTLQDGIKNFDPNTKEWENYNKQLQRATLDLQSIRNELSKVPHANLQVISKNFEDWGKSLDNVGTKLENIGKKLAVLTVGIVGLGTAGVKFNAQLEQYQTAFTTLIGDAEKASVAIERIQQGSTLTPFSTESLIEANQYLISAGVEAEDAYDMIMNLGDAISATGGGSAELSRMAQNLQQIKNLGKASSVDIKQFANAGINIYGLLAETTGRSVEQLKKMDITYGELEKAFAKASSEGGKYFGAMENQSQTLSGSISTLKDTFNQLLGELTKDLVPVIKNIIQFMQDLVKRVKEMSPEQKAMITRIAEIIALLSPVLSIGGGLIQTLGGISTKIGGLLKNEKIVAMIAKLTSNGTTLGGVLKTIFTVIKGMINPFTIILGILGFLYATNEDIREQINNLVASLIGLFKPTIELVSNIIQILWELLKEVVNIIIIMWEEFKKSEAGKKFIEIIKQVIGWVQTAIDWISKLVGWLIDATNWFLNLINAGRDAQSYTIGGSARGDYSSNGGAWVSRSGGYNSGGQITLNANFTVNSNNIGRDEVRQWSSWIADDINEALGRKIR